ncbi:hypothetical protein NYR89_07855 [Actinobacillus arthritidis]|nr:hypothetical protein [Actinobacillus arthritidis]WGE88974.1 hypothetical protein NYR89_07855 [Actinobacillus arthritidis]
MQAGIGPEVIVKSLEDNRIYELAQPVVIGDCKIMQRALTIIGSTLKLRVITDISDAYGEFGVIDLLDLDNLPANLPFSQVSPLAGKALTIILKRLFN